MVDKQMKELESLVSEVLKKQDRIIPIIGDNCFGGKIADVKNPDMSTSVTLLEWVVEKMLGGAVQSEKKKLITCSGYRGLDMLYDEYKRIYQEEDEDFPYTDFKEPLVTIVEKGIKDKQIYLRNDIKDFLRAGRFDVVVTTCPFHILEKEISEEGFQYNVSSFAPISIRNISNSANSNSTNSISKSETELKLPSIYQVFGDCEGEFVLGEDDLLKFLHYLNHAESEKGYGASPLVKYILNKMGENNKGDCLLMPIGCDNLPNWLFRFLWYPFSSECLRGKDKNNQGGVWHKYSEDKSFYKFLRKYHFKTFSNSTDSLREGNSDSDPVLERLTKELLKKKIEIQGKKGEIEKYATHELNVLWNEDDTWDVFLSYASEDYEIVKQIYEILTTRCNLNVWMDKRGGIKPGELYWEAIQHGIEHSKKYMFVITESYLAKAIDKNHRDENGFICPTGVFQETDRIRQYFISQRRDGKSRFYSIPLIQEGTKVSFTDLNNVRHEGINLNGALLERLHNFVEYQLLQTDVIFEGVEALEFAKTNIEDNLINIFKG